MVGGKTQETLTRLALELGVVALLALTFAFLGVYNSDTMPWGFRFLFWFVLMAAGSLALSMTEPWVLKRLLPGQALPLQIMTISLIIAVPLTIGLVGLNTDLSWNYSVSNWGLQFLAVLIIAIVIVSGRFVIRALLSQPYERVSVEEENPAGAFLQRLPLKYREAELWAVSSEGHYLRVHTDKGEPMILLRLADAVKELQDVDGLQTHRSWWVARQGISEVRQFQGKTTLKLKNGIDAPVSRARLKDVKSAGWN